VFDMKKFMQHKLLTAIMIFLVIFIGVAAFFKSSPQRRIDSAQNLCEKGKYANGLNRLDSLETEVLDGGDAETIASLYNAMAECYLYSAWKDGGREDAQHALTVAEKSVSYLSDGGNQKQSAQSLITRGRIYSQLAKHENHEEYYLKAIDDFKRSLKMWEELGRVSGAYYCSIDLGMAQKSLGTFTNTQKYISESIDTFKKALDNLPGGIRDSMVAVVYIDLAKSFQVVRKMQKSENAQLQCVTAYEKALDLLNVKREPEKYLQTGIHMGEALYAFAYPPDRECLFMAQCYDKDEIDLQSVHRAFALYDSMMDEFPADKFPKEHSYIAVTRAELWTIVAPRLGEYHYSNAIAVLQNELTKLEDELPESWFQSYNALLGDAYYGLARAKQDTKYAQKAIEAYEMAFDKTLPEESATNISMQTRQGLSHLLLFKQKQDEADGQKALALFQKADAACVAEIMPDVCFITGYNLGDAYAELASVADQAENRQKAVAAYAKALAIPGLDTETKRYKRVQEKLQTVQAAAGAE